MNQLIEDSADILIHEESNNIFNYTTVDIPMAANRILNLEPNYGLPIQIQRMPIPNLIKDLEAALSRIKLEETDTRKKEDIVNGLRAKTVNIITNFTKRSHKHHNHQSQITKDVIATKRFLKDNDNLIVAKSDKGNSTVIWYKEEYLRKMHEMLSDQTTYLKVKKDPTNKHQIRANKIIESLVKSNIIDKQEARSLTTYNAVPPKIYGLRKTHKQGCVLRPVVSCIDSLSYKVAALLHKYLIPYNILTFEHNMKDSFDFVRTLRTVELQEGYIMVSLNVVSLFTNVPKDLVTDIITKHWTQVKQHVRVEQNMLVEMINFCFESGYFSFQGEIYDQLDGCSMGNPASPSVANIAMNHIIEEAKQKLPFPIPFIKVYVDDTFIIIPRDGTDILLETFNSIHQRIQFTMELESELGLPFLDTLVKRNGDQLTTEMYSKPTNSNRILNFLSHHPLSQKLGVACGIFNRAVRLSTHDKVDISIEKAKSILRTNNYPNKIVKKCLGKTRARLEHAPQNATPEKIYSRFPFVAGLSERVGKCFGTTNCRLGFYNLNKVRGMYTRLKDKVDPNKRSNEVYKIPCSCNKHYIGQTKQLLKNRLNQHRLDCRNGNYLNKDKTALATHHFDTGHNFQFDKTTILDYETNWWKRNVSEMVFIKLHDTVNLRTDTQQLSAIYSNILTDYRQELNRIRRPTQT